MFFKWGQKYPIAEQQKVSQKGESGKTLDDGNYTQTQ